MDITYHYPPELMNLLIETIPLLCKSKDDTLLFFKGAGVSEKLYRDLAQIVAIDRQNISKYEIVRKILTRLNNNGELALGERREVLKRIVEFEDFSTCWPADQLKAKGLVAEIRRVINVKDTFTRINQEREKERQQRQADHQAQIQKENAKRSEIETIKKDLYSLFGDTNPFKRGKALEGILNRLFKAYDILVSDAFTIRGEEKEGIVEQIDGLIEFDGHLYLVEMKWLNVPVGKGEMAQHLVNVYGRGEARGIFISASGYSEPAIAVCKDAIHKKVIVLVELQEIVNVLDRSFDFKKLLKEKVQASIAYEEPLYHIDIPY
jgi:restriction system protein